MYVRVYNYLQAEKIRDMNLSKDTALLETLKQQTRERIEKVHTKFFGLNISGTNLRYFI